MYAANKGRCTTLCMFWTAADVFKLRYNQGRNEEAVKIPEALKRILPHVEAITKEFDSEYSAVPVTESKFPWKYNDKNNSPLPPLATSHPPSTASIDNIAHNQRYRRIIYKINNALPRNPRCRR